MIADTGFLPKSLGRHFLLGCPATLCQFARRTLTLPAMKRHNLLNTFLIASVVSTVAMTAIAAPQPLEKTVAPAPPSEFHWPGHYIGSNVDVVWTNYDASKYRTHVNFEDQINEVVSDTIQCTDIAT